MWGQVGEVKSLIDHGADVSAVDEDGMTPLHLAAIEGKPRIVRTLLNLGADPNAQTPYFETPLHMAARRGWLGTVKAFFVGPSKLEVCTAVSDVVRDLKLCGRKRDPFHHERIGG